MATCCCTGACKKPPYTCNGNSADFIKENLIPLDRLKFLKTETEKPKLDYVDLIISGLQ